MQIRADAPQRAGKCDSTKERTSDKNGLFSKTMSAPNELVMTQPDDEKGFAGPRA